MGGKGQLFLTEELQLIDRSTRVEKEETVTRTVVLIIVSGKNHQRMPN